MDGLNLKSTAAGVVLIVAVVLVAVFKDSESGFSNGNPMDAHFQDFDSLALVEFDPFNSNFDGFQYVDGEAGSVERGFCGWVGDFIVADIADESQGHEVLVEFTGSCWSGWWSEIFMFAGNTSETVQLGDGIGGEFLVRLDNDNGIVTATRSWADGDPMCCPTQFLVTKHFWTDGDWVEEWSDYWIFEGEY